MEKTKMVELRLDGRTYAHIAAMAGVSRQRIQQLIAPPKEVREFVVNKYNNRCADCMLYVGRSGHIHHEGSTNGDDYNDVGSLILLCISCHQKRHLPKMVLPVAFTQEKVKAKGPQKLTERNLAIVKYCKNPDLSLRQIGIIYGITKQRVWAIRNAYQRPPQPSERGHRQLCMEWVKSLFARYRKATRFH